MTFVIFALICESRGFAKEIEIEECVRTLLAIWRSPVVKVALPSNHRNYPNYCFMSNPHIFLRIFHPDVTTLKKLYHWTYDFLIWHSPWPKHHAIAWSKVYYTGLSGKLAIGGWAYIDRRLGIGTLLQSIYFHHGLIAGPLDPYNLQKLPPPALVDSPDYILHVTFISFRKSTPWAASSVPMGSRRVQHCPWKKRFPHTI